jgi:thioredoxin 1
MKLKKGFIVRMLMIKVSKKQDLDDHLTQNKTVLALFYSSWCPYCIRFVPFFEKKVTGGQFKKVIHVLLEDDNNPLWEEYGISAVPTVILFEEGKVRDRLDARLGTGLREEQFAKWLTEQKEP